MTTPYAADDRSGAEPDEPGTPRGERIHRPEDRQGDEAQDDRSLNPPAVDILIERK
jgi:hypothetical protein